MSFFTLRLSIIVAVVDATKVAKLTFGVTGGEVTAGVEGAAVVKRGGIVRAGVVPATRESSMSFSACVSLSFCGRGGFESCKIDFWGNWRCGHGVGRWCSRRHGGRRCEKRRCEKRRCPCHAVTRES